MWSADFLATVMLAFVLAGFVKGVIGMGLPTVSLAIMTATIGLRDAMALMIVPSLLTNVWQMFSGPYLRQIASRFWPLTVAAVAGIFVGLELGIAIGVSWLVAVLGCVLLVYSALGLVSVRLPFRFSNERTAGLVMGLASGVMTGLVGVFIVPTVFYLQALKMEKDMFVQTLGLLFIVATVTLGAGLSKLGLLTPQQFLLSGIAVAPAFAGMWVGQVVRKRLTEDSFRKAVFLGLGFVGLYLILRAWGQTGV